MTISHTQTFFENIDHLEESAIVREVKRLRSLNSRDNRYFDMEAYRRKLLQTLPTNIVDNIMDSVSKPYEQKYVNHSTNTSEATKDAQRIRKAMKANMRSRRQSR